MINKIFQRITVLFLLIIYAGINYAGAQTAVPVDTTGIVRGRFVDEEGQPLPGVTVRMVMITDSITRGGAMADSTGRFAVRRLPVGRYMLHYSLIGYRAGMAPFILTKSRPVISFPDIAVEQSDIALGEAVVTGTLPPVTVVGDTVAYNADAYKTPEGSMVEDLIEKIPGAEITDDGKIKINGKVYSKILVDGKEFFGDDPQAAIKNLPANIIKRIKTYDRKSAQARLTGIDDGEENNVIDLEVKPNMKKGWIGSVQGALGNHSRYQAGLSMSRFRNDSHLSINYDMNNVNNPRFSERGGGGQNFSRGARSGLTSSKSFGTSFATEKRNKYKVYGNVNFGYSNGEQMTSSHSETDYNDSTFRYSDNVNHSMRGRYDFSVSLSTEWKPDTLTTLQLNPSFSYNKTNSWSTGSSSSDKWNGNERSDTVRINDHQSLNTSHAQGTNESLSFSVYRRLSRTGRNISFNTSYNYSDNSSDNFSRNIMNYFLQPSKNRNYNRYSDGNGFSKGFNAGISYSEPIYKGGFLQFRYSYSYRHSRSNRYGYEVNHTAADSLIQNEPIDWTQVPVDTALSSCNENTYINHSINLNMRHTSEKINLSYGVNLNPRHNETNYIFGPKMDKGLLKQNLLSWSPSIDFKYRFTKRIYLDFDYHGNSNEPNIDELQEVISKVNPQNISYGNPGLKPSFTNNMSMNFNYYGEKSHRSLVTNFYYSNTNNNTSNLTLYDSNTGARVSKLMNVNGQWNTSGNINFNTPLDSMQRFNISLSTQMNFNENTNYNTTPLTQKNLTDVGVLKDFSDIDPDDIDKLMPYALKNHTHTFSLHQSLSFRFRNKWFSAGLNGSLSYYNVKNSIQKSNGRNTMDYSLRGNVEVELPWDVQVATNCNFTSRHGYSANIQKNIAIWNAQINKNFLKRNMGSLRFQIFDILHQRSNVNRSINNLTISDTRSMALSDYFLLTFQLRINTFGRGMGRGNRNFGNSGSSGSSGNRGNNGQNRGRSR